MASALSDGSMAISAVLQAKRLVMASRAMRVSGFITFDFFISPTDGNVAGSESQALRSSMDKPDTPGFFFDNKGEAINKHQGKCVNHGNED